MVALFYFKEMLKNRQKNDIITMYVMYIGRKGEKLGRKIKSRYFRWYRNGWTEVYYAP